jgi:hypothetical protein
MGTDRTDRITTSMYFELWHEVFGVNIVKSASPPIGSYITELGSDKSRPILDPAALHELQPLPRRHRPARLVAGGPDTKS